MNSLCLLATLLTVSGEFTQPVMFTDPVFIRQLDQSILLVQAPVAEEIKGRVVTSTGAAALSGVSVSLLDAEDSIVDVTDTDKEGRFVLELDVLDEISPQIIFGLSIMIETSNGAQMKVPLADVAGRYAQVIRLRDINFR